MRDYTSPFSKTIVVTRKNPPSQYYGAITKAVKKGRKAKWIPEALRKCDYDEGMRLLKEWGRDNNTKLRVQGNFMSVCRMSGLAHNDPMAAAGILGQMSLNGLGPGTRATYMEYIRKKFPAAREASHAAGVCAADHEAHHAPDIEDAVLWQYVIHAPDEWRPLIYLMYVCGFRVKAIKFFRRRRIFLPPWKNWASRDLEIVVAVDKNRPKKGKRATLILPSSWNYPRPPTRQDYSFLMDGDADEKLFSNLTASKVNVVLRKISKEKSLPRPTTYSFRRGYINRVLELVKDKDKVNRYSLHFDPATVDAFYRRTAKEKEAMNKE